jgi:hypothetical protein
MSHDLLCIQFSSMKATCMSDNQELQMHHAFSTQSNSMQTTTPYWDNMLSEREADRNCGAHY